MEPDEKPNEGGFWIGVLECVNIEALFINMVLIGLFTAGIPEGISQKAFAKTVWVFAGLSLGYYVIGVLIPVLGGPSKRGGMLVVHFLISLVLGVLGVLWVLKFKMK